MPRGKKPQPPGGSAEIVDFSKIKEHIEEHEQTIDYQLFSEDANLKRMNEAHAFIHSYGGKPAVLSHIYSEVIDKEAIEFSTPDSIQVRYANQSVLVNDKSQMELGKWWLKHAGRREYQTVIFDPSQPKEYKGCLNLWEGFSVEPIKGSWRHTRKHIYKILCNKNKTKFKYFMRWLAWCIQNPATQAEVCCVFKGKEGAGKGFIFTQMVSICGVHGFTLADRKLLTGMHNGHFNRIIFLFADEAYYPGDKEAEGVLKQLITQPTIAVRAMYKDAVMGKNRLHIGMSTNNEWVIPAGEDARRYFINEVDNKYAKGQETETKRNAYFSKLWKEMEQDGGQAAMLYDLLNIKLHGWHPRYDVPDTEELQKQKAMNLNVLENAVFSILEDGFFPGTINDKGMLIIGSHELQEYIERIEPMTKRFSSTKKLEIFRKLGCEKWRRPDRVYWVFPDLIRMRQKWNELYIHNKNWKLEEEWYIQRTEY